MGFIIVLESILWSHKGFIFWLRIFRKCHAWWLRPVYWSIAISGSKLILQIASHGWVSCIFQAAPEMANALHDGTVVFFGPEVFKQGAYFLYEFGEPSFIFASAFLFCVALGTDFLYEFVEPIFIFASEFFCVSWKTPMRLSYFKLPRN